MSNIIRRSCFRDSKNLESLNHKHRNNKKWMGWDIHDNTRILAPKSKELGSIAYAGGLHEGIVYEESQYHFWVRFGVSSVRKGSRRRRGDLAFSRSESTKLCQFPDVMGVQDLYTKEDMSPNAQAINKILPEQFAMLVQAWASFCYTNSRLPKLLLEKMVERSTISFEDQQKIKTQRRTLRDEYHGRPNDVITDVHYELDFVAVAKINAGHLTRIRKYIIRNKRDFSTHDDWIPQFVALGATATLLVALDGFEEEINVAWTAVSEIFDLGTIFASINTTDDDNSTSGEGCGGVLAKCCQAIGDALFGEDTR